MSGVRQIEVGPDEGDQRIDRWLRRRFPQLGQGRIEKMCRKGELRVDGGRVKPATRVEVGQTVRVPPIPDAAPAAPKARPEVSGADAEMLRSRVLWRDDHLLALDKPAGLAVQGGSGQDRHVDGMAEALRFDADAPPRLVHRLDRETSGVLLMARTRSAAAAATAAFRARETRKIYWAAVAGTPTPRMGTIKYGLVKGQGERMETVHPQQVEATPGAKRALSDYAVLDDAGGRVSWAALVPVTGRTHQLRAHMAALGHPIVGDGRYGGRGQENLGDGWGAMLGGAVSRKMHLHARSLSFDHPVTGRRVTITAPLPEHMQATWDLLGWRPEDVPADPFEEMDP
ncbi:RluA family pseudouridine synthase [Jannaschia sp. Os4]|uniref:RluA family pseudouridine synthase n=1 Tax=Jannaschia sp. Os4 TaxID=2807617 RepID=UPI00193998CD|nr:RluA family pseudouridine synthase [Jannaschia sp. Os4]